MSDLLPAGDNLLSDLAGRVREANDAMLAASYEAAERALEAGALLIEAKAECGHGSWLHFLERAGVHERQARRLMQLARSGLKPDTVSDLGIKGALEFIAKRTLPENGKVLQVSTPLEGDGYGGTAWAWESKDHPGYYDVAGAAAEFKTMYATKQPVDGVRPEIIFQYVDEILGHRYADMIFTLLRMDRDHCERFRTAVRIGENLSAIELISESLDAIGREPA